MPELILGQTNINNKILELLETTKEYVIWISMLSELTDPILTRTINNLIKKNVKIYIYHSINPFLNDTKTDYRLKINQMHGEYLIKKNVNHMRFLSNEKCSLFGGIDFNKKIDIAGFQQHALQVNNCKSIYNLHDYIISNKSLYNYKFQYPIIGTTSSDYSAKYNILNLIKKVNRRIIIESQYFEHKLIIKTIIDMCKNKDIQLVVIFNENFHNNPISKKMPFTNIVKDYLKNETIKNINLIKKSNIDAKFLYFKNGYTHNKIYIFDDYFIMGTSNLNQRSFEKKNDLEIGYIIENKDIIDKYLNYVNTGAIKYN